MDVEIICCMIEDPLTGRRYHGRPVRCVLLLSLFGFLQSTRWLSRRNVHFLEEGRGRGRASLADSEIILECWSIDSERVWRFRRSLRSSSSSEAPSRLAEVSSHSRGLALPVQQPAGIPPHWQDTQHSGCPRGSHRCHAPVPHLAMNLEGFFVCHAGRLGEEALWLHQVLHGMCPLRSTVLLDGGPVRLL